MSLQTKKNVSRISVLLDDADASVEAQANVIVFPKHDDLGEIAKQLIRLMQRVQECTIEALALLETLQDRSKTKGKREKDKYGEPTWEYMVKVTIPKTLYLTRTFREYATSRGMTDPEIAEQWETFVNWYDKKGTKWKHWSKVWFDWCRRYLKIKADEAKTAPASSRTSKTFKELT